MLAKSSTPMYPGKALKSLGLAILLVLSTLAVKGQLPTKAQGFVIKEGTTIDEWGVASDPIVGATLEGILKGTTAGFTTTTAADGIWNYDDVPLTGDPNGIFDRKAQFTNDKLQVIYEQGQIRFKMKTDNPLHFGTIYNLSSQEIANLQFYEVDQGVVEAIWQTESDRPTQLYIFKDEKGRAAKVTPWAMNSGELKYQEIDLNAIHPSVKKGAQNTQGTVTYILTYTHPEYQTLVVETEFRTADINTINVEMSPKQAELFGQFRAAIETDQGEFLPGKIVLTGLDVEYKDSVVLVELPVHDFTNIPIDPSDGVTSLHAMVVPTSIAFDTAFINIDIVEGNNPFQSLIVNKTEIVGKRIAIEAILGQSEVPAENYWIIIRDEAGTELYNGLASESEHLTPKIEEGSNVTLSAYFPNDDPLNRDETHAGFVRAPLSIGAMASPSDTVIALPLRFTPLAPLDPYTDKPLPLDPEWITDMTGGSYNLSFWDDGVEDVYLAPNVDTTTYKELISYINSHFGINLQENWVSELITGDAYGLNITQDGTGGETPLRSTGNGTHIGANINLPANLAGRVKERLGRWYQFTTVTKRDNSFMKASPSEPTKEDRAIVYEIIKHQEAINDGKATYIQFYIGKTSDGGF